ncbi:MAG: RNA polymerase sigma factor [Phycisphaerae bacterium]|nr:RNA polymerase sigma factor [Phycisphaerae bacterium]
MTEPQEIENLIQKCKKGDAEAFNRLIELYADRCYAYFFRLTGRTHVSEELLSDLFIRLVKKIHSFKGGSFQNWLFTMASNLFRDYLRRQSRQKKIIEKKAALLEAGQTSPKRKDRIFDNLQVALEKLDAETAELITLRYYGEMSFKDLAAMRNEPIGTTLSKVHRGVKKLRHIMERL